jgi:ubiquinone/menaquinone biosynthesis C-methylase UbiE
MKTRESGMPEDELWQTFFEPAAILDRLGLGPECHSAVDFGVGYGTFSLAAAARIAGRVFAYDIDPEMVAVTERKARALGLGRLEVVLRDFVEQGTGLSERSIDYVMLFNILHATEAPTLLAEARRVLRPDGKLAVIHWNYDPTTPRGPSMEIRLRPEECRDLAAAAGFKPGPILDLPPYHYGFTASL